MASISDDICQLGTVKKETYVDLKKIQEQVQLLQYSRAASTFTKLLTDDSHCISATDATINQKTASAVQWVYEALLSHLSPGEAFQTVVEPSLPVLQKIIAYDITLLEQIFEDNKPSNDVEQLLMGCYVSIECCQSLVSYVTENGDNIEASLYADLPSALLEMLHAVLLHCRHRGPSYDECSDGVREAVSQLLRASVQCTTAVFVAMATLTAQTDPLIKATLVNQISSHCRLLSMLSEMKAVVQGWKSLSLLVQQLRAEEDGGRLVQEGALDMMLVVQELAQEVQEGLELLYVLHQENAKSSCPQSATTVVRRVVKMCSACIKLAMMLLDAFVEHARPAVLRAVLDFCLVLARCCVCVSVQQSGTAVGEGLAEQLLLGVQLLLGAVMARPQCGEILRSSVCLWIREAEVLEQQYLANQPRLAATVDDSDCSTADSAEDANVPNSAEYWSSITGGPYLVLYSMCLLLPSTPSSLQLPGAVLAALLDYLPHCSGLFCSTLTLKAPPEGGQAPAALPLYEATVVAASVAVAGVRDTEWQGVELRLWVALLGGTQTRQKTDKLGINYCKKAKENNDKQVKIDKDSDDDDDFVKNSSCSPCTEDADEVKSFPSLAGQTSARRKDWWWPHILAADILAFVARLGSAELCSAQYQSLSALLPHLSQHDTVLLPHLAHFLARVQHFLPQQPSTLPFGEAPTVHQATAALLRSYLSGLALYDDTHQCGQEYLRHCRQHCDELCLAVRRDVEAVLDTARNDDGAQALLDLHHRLSCLHLLLVPRPRVGGGGPELAGVGDALAMLWERYPLATAGSSAGDWLLCAVAMVTADVADMLDNSQLMTVLSVCVVCAAQGGRAVQEAVSGVLASLAHCALEGPSQHLTDAVVELSVGLLERGDGCWLRQCAMEDFIHFAQHTQHQQIVSSVIQRCSSQVQNSLQKFLLQEPHSPPIKAVSSLPESQDEAFSAAQTNPSDGHVAPLFLFEQQCVSNRSGGSGSFASPFVSLATSAGPVRTATLRATRKRHRSDDTIGIPIHNSDINSNMPANAQQSCTMKKSTNESRKELFSQISLNINEAKKYLDDASYTNFDGEEEQLQDALKLSKCLVDTVRQLHRKQTDDR